MDGELEPFFNGDHLPAFYDVVGMAHDLFLWTPGDAVTREEPKKRAFIGRQPPADMPLHNPGNILRNTHFPENKRSNLGMIKAMGLRSPDIMEQCSRGNEFRVCKP